MGKEPVLTEKRLDKMIKKARKGLGKSKSVGKKKEIDACNLDGLGWHLFGCSHYDWMKAKPQPSIRKYCNREHDIDILCDNPDHPYSPPKPKEYDKGCSCFWCKRGKCDACYGQGLYGDSICSQCNATGKKPPVSSKCSCVCHTAQVKGGLKTQCRCGAVYLGDDKPFKHEPSECAPKPYTEIGAKAQLHKKGQCLLYGCVLCAPESEWEKALEQLVYAFNNGQYDDNPLLEDGPLFMWSTRQHRRIKSFISSLLANQKREIIDELNKKLIVINKDCLAINVKDWKKLLKT